MPRKGAGAYQKNNGKKKKRGEVLLLDDWHNNQAEIADLIRLLWDSCERRNARRTCCWVLTRNLKCEHTLICYLPPSPSCSPPPSPSLSQLICRTNFGCNSTDVAACWGICNNWKPGKRDFRAGTEIINELERGGREKRGGRVAACGNHRITTIWKLAESTERAKLLIMLTIFTLSNSQLISSSNFGTEGTLLSTLDWRDPLAIFHCLETNG